MMSLIKSLIAESQNYEKETVLFYLLDKYLISCQLQTERIKNDSKNQKEQIEFVIKGGEKISGWAEYQEYLFIDIHFFLIGVSNTGKILEKLKKIRSYDSDFVNICKKYIKPIQKIDRFRDHLEHITERLSGKDKKGRKLKNPSDLGNLDRDNFTFGGESLDLKDSINLINNLVDDFISWQSSKELKEDSKN